MCTPHLVILNGTDVFARAVRENIVCTKMLPLVWFTNCDLKQKSFMNTMLADRIKDPYTKSLFPIAPIRQCVPLNSGIGSTLVFLKYFCLLFADIDNCLVNVRLLLS